MANLREKRTFDFFESDQESDGDSNFENNSSESPDEENDEANSKENEEIVAAIPAKGNEVENKKKKKNPKPIEVEMPDYAANNFELSKLSKSSQNPTWKYFGVLQKDGQIVQKMQSRIICCECFKKNTIKR